MNFEEKILNKIKLVDNDLTTSLILTKEEFLNFKEIKEENCLILKKFNLKEITVFLVKVEENEGDIYLLLDGNEKLNERDIEDFSNLDISDYSDKKVYRVILTSHKILNENLNKLLEETVVFFNDENLSLNTL